jgi:hypothetical protein
MLTFSTISNIFTVTILDLGLGILIGVVTNYVFGRFINSDSPTIPRLGIEIVAQALFSMVALAEVTTFFSNVYANEPVSGLMLFLIAFIVQVNFIEKLQSVAGLLQAWIAFKLNGLGDGGDEDGDMNGDRE